MKKTSKPKVTSDKTKEQGTLRTDDLLGINGLHLWEVKMNYHRDDVSHYWITTKKRNIKTAVDKATRHGKTKVGVMAEFAVSLIKYRGTLDA